MKHRQYTFKDKGVEKKLNTVLAILDEDIITCESVEFIVHKIKPNPSYKEIYMIAEHLLKDEYVGKTIAKTENNTVKIDMYFITYSGRLFLSQNGYVGEKRRMTHKTIWTVAKIVATIANAMLIIYIAWLSVLTQKEANMQEQQIKIMQETIDNYKKIKQPSPYEIF